MQLHEEALAESTTNFDWSGAGCLAIIQLLLFVALGFTLTWAWTAYCSCKLKLTAKKVDDVDEASNGQVDAGYENESVSPARSAVKARQSNAQERKRLRKASQSESKKDSAKAGQLPTHPVAVRAISSACKVIAKKTEHEKNQVRKEAASQNVAKVPRSPLRDEKYDEDTVSQDDESKLSPTASTPSVLSDSDASPRSMDLTECTDSPRSKASWDRSHSPRQLYTRRERRIMQSRELHQILSTPCSLLSGLASSTELQQQKELGAPLPKDLPETNHSISDALRDSVESETSQLESDAVCDGVELHAKEQLDTCDYDHSDDLDNNAWQASSNSEMDFLPDTCVNLHGHAASTRNCASLSDSANEMASTPVLWCSVLEGPIEGWVAVTLPSESAPPGALDGLWMNKAEEKILIEKLEIMFESGMMWHMEMHSLTSISVSIDGQTVCADLDGAGEKLLWSDGDVWAFFGRAEDSSQAMVELESVMVPFFPDNFQVYEEMPMPPQSHWMPRDVKRWNVCWDWEKKGRCPRGANCEWYHPESTFF